MSRPALILLIAFGVLFGAAGGLNLYAYAQCKGSNNVTMCMSQLWSDKGNGHVR